MPRETICVYCEKPLLDAEHAKKHVLEQCAKAPWRKRLAEMEQANSRLMQERDAALSEGRGLQEKVTATEEGLARVEAASARALAGDKDKRSLVATLTLVVERTQAMRTMLRTPGCGCAETYPQLQPGKVNHGPGCASRENTPLCERWKLAEAPIAFVRTFARALLGDEDGGVHDWMRESGDGSLLVEWHAALASLARLDAAPDKTTLRQPCRACGGSGRVGDAPCGSCGGSGKGQTR